MKKSTTVLALTLSALFASAGNAVAGEYGCKVLMCLANPNGPTAAADCVPPIHQLWKDLRKGKGFPSCEEAGNGNQAGNTWASQEYCHPSLLVYNGSVMGQDQYSCKARGAVNVTLDTGDKARIWWGVNGQDETTLMENTMSIGEKQGAPLVDPRAAYIAAEKQRCNSSNIGFLGSNIGNNCNSVQNNFFGLNQY